MRRSLQPKVVMRREVGEEFVGDSGDRVNPLTELGRKAESRIHMHPISLMKFLARAEFSLLLVMSVHSFSLLLLFNF